MAVEYKKDVFFCDILQPDKYMCNSHFLHITENTQTYIRFKLHFQQTFQYNTPQYNSLNVAISRRHMIINCSCMFL